MQNNTQRIIINVFYRTLINKFIVMLSCVLLLLANGCTSNNRDSDNMLPSNFYEVSDELYRSEQPSQKEMKNLSQLGVKTVINLRLWHSDRDEVEDTDIDDVWIRMRAGNITDEKIIEILQTIQRSPKPILVHCWHGSDRTGVVVAMYRIVFQNWSKSAAIDELMHPAFGHHYNVYPNIVKYLQDVDVEKIKTAVFKD